MNPEHNTEHSIVALRAHFPLLQETMRGAPLVYLDSAATSLTPRCVTEAITEYYHRYGVSVHRGIYQLSERATAAYEETRAVCSAFLGCGKDYEIIFTHGATESINLVAHSVVAAQLRAGDEIVITECEHHSNIVPWQLAAARHGLKLRALRIDPHNGALTEEELNTWRSPRTKLLAITAMSNVTGYRPPLERLIAEARDAGIYTLVDGAQHAVHTPRPMAALECDFYAFSAHKVFGPTGVGVLCARRALLKDVEPFIAGGNVISEVHIAHSTWRPPPARFEAGTPHIAGVVGMKRALEWLATLDRASLAAHQARVVAYARTRLREFPHLQIYGDLHDSHSPALSFNIAGAHPHDVAAILDQHGVAIRVGHHCAQPYLRALGTPSVARASFGVHNHQGDVDRLIEGIAHTIKVFER